MLRIFVLAAIASAASFPAAAQDIAPAAPTAAPERTVPPTPMEVRARLAAAFAKYDEGDKGHLTSEEFATMMANEQGNQDSARTQAIFTAADSDNNDQLSLGEFTGFVEAQLARRGRPQISEGPRRGRGGRMLAQFEETWDRFDEGAKGYLAVDEFIAMMADLRAKAAETRAERGYTGRARGPATSEEIEERSRETFAKADTDSNGELTQEELREHFRAMREQRGARRGERSRGEPGATDGVVDDGGEGR